MNSFVIRLATPLLVITSTLAVSQSAMAQRYPTRTVTIVVGYAPGGSTDTAGRMIGAKLSEALGQTFIVENRPGANAIVAHRAVARAAPDGYTLIISSTADTVNVTLNADKTQYSYLTDFQPIARLTQSAFLVIVPPSLPVKTVKELLEFGKKGNINFGSSGVGTPSHLGAELMFLSKGMKANHVPYNGAGPAATAVMRGEIHLAFANMSSSINLAAAGKLRAIAVSSKQRSELAPEFPTLNESGFPGFDVVSWAGIDAPAGTPADIVKLLADHCLAILKTPEFKAALGKVGTEPYPLNTAGYAAFLKGEVAQWARVLKSAGVTSQ